MQLKQITNFLDRYDCKYETWQSWEKIFIKNIENGSYIYSPFIDLDFIIDIFNLLASSQFEKDYLNFCTQNKFLYWPNDFWKYYNNFLEHLQTLYFNK